MAIPRADPLDSEAQVNRRRDPPARGIQQVKVVEGDIEAHAAQHKTGGSDAVTPAGIGAAEGGHPHILRAPTSTDNVASPPTDAELDTAFGQPAVLGDGFFGLLDDNDAGTTVWLCYVINLAWWYEQLTKAT